jgi:hypothetical protein
MKKEKTLLVTLSVAKGLNKLQVAENQKDSCQNIAPGPSLRSG